MLELVDARNIEVQSDGVDTAPGRVGLVASAVNTKGQMMAIVCCDDGVEELVVDKLLAGGGLLHNFDLVVIDIAGSGSS